MAGLVDKWRNWRDLVGRKKAATQSIPTHDPGTVKAAFANLRPEEVTDEEKSGYLRAAIDQQNVLVFKEVLRFVDNPNLEIAVDKGGRYSDWHYYSPLSYALTQARTHDISLVLAGDPRVNVTEDSLGTAKLYGMSDVATVLTKRLADVARHESDLRLQEAAHLDQQAAAPTALDQATSPATEPPAPASASANNAGANQDNWVLMSDTSVAHVVTTPALNRKLTNIFNFEDKERVIITEKLDTGKETVAPAEKFEAVSADAVKRAEDKLKELKAEAPKRSFSL